MFILSGTGANPQLALARLNVFGVLVAGPTPAHPSIKEAAFGPLHKRGAARCLRPSAPYLQSFMGGFARIGNAASAPSH